MADPSLLQIVGGGFAGAGLTYGLTWLRERRRMKDAYRAPQRDAIAGIVTAIHQLLVSESDLREAAESLMQSSNPIADGDLGHVMDAFGRAVYGVEAAFNVGKITVVDAVCREYMGRAYNTFILQVQSLTTSFSDVTAKDATKRMPAFIEQYQSAVKGLNVTVADLVDASQDRISPTQSRLNWWRRRGVRKRLREHAASAPPLQVPAGPSERRLVNVPPGFKLPDADR